MKKTLEDSAFIIFNILLARMGELLFFLFVIDYFISRTLFHFVIMSSFFVASVWSEKMVIDALKERWDLDNKGIQDFYDY